MKPIVTLALLFAVVSSTKAADRPNFVVIMADDLGYADISCYRSEEGETRNDYRTPHIDQLAAEGLRLTDYHSNGAVCSPTRAALLTGRYQQRAGVDGIFNASPDANRDDGMAVSEVTFADVLSAAGYKTALFGKWHLGYAPKFNPVHQGFDLFRGYVSGNVDYVSHLDRMGIEDWWHNDQLQPETGYTTHLITRHTLDFIRANRDQPFCVYVAHESVHNPFQGPNDPAIRVTVGEEDRTGNRISRPVPDVYAEMVIEMDKGVGEIVALLRELQLDRQTLVVFISDNGATREGNNGSLRGYKGSLWEGGHRVPGIAWQPGAIPPGESAETVLSMDWFPTLIELANATWPAGVTLDGVSLTKLLHERHPLPARTLFWKYGNQWAIRRGHLKLVQTKPKVQPELFDLRADLSERRNIAGEHADLARELEEEYGAWSAGILLDREGEDVPSSTEN